MSEPAICSEEFPVVRLAGPDDLVDAVPYLIGFEPVDSLVFIAVRGQRRRIGLTLRIDLPALDAAPPAIAQCLEHVRRSGAEGLLLAVYRTGAPEPGAPLPYEDEIADIAGELAADDIDLVEAVLVADGRWRSYLCSNPMCCPPEGRPVRDRQTPSAVMAAATVAGLSVAASRSELARSLLPVPRPQRRRLAAQVKQEEQRWRGAERAERHEATVRAWRAGILSQGRAETILPSAEVALLLVGLQDIGVRDECCAAVREEHRRGAYALARQLARRAVRPYDVAPYTLTSWLAWLSGNGVLARVAVDRALVSDPEYRLGLLMEQLLDCGVDPAGWRMDSDD